MWPTENPWPLMILALVAGIACLIGWSQRRQNVLLLAAAACFLLAAGAWLLDLSVVTPREEIRADVYGIVRAFQRRDLERTVSYVSDSAKDLKLIIGTAYNLIEVHDDMRISDVQAELIAQNQRAKTRFRVNATVTHELGSQHVSSLWEARWQREPGGWKMIDIVPFDPITGERVYWVDYLRSNVRRIYF